MKMPRSYGLTALVLLLVMLGSATASPAEDISLGQKLDKLFAKWDSLDSPGAAVIVIKDGLVVYRKGFGCAQLEYGIPITPSTVFHVASVSKQFTAMAITMLEEAGKLSADDDVRKYVPELADFGKTITLRHLLNHTSGLRDQWELLVLSGWRMDDVITQADIMDRLARQRELNFAPGTRYLYCNSGFTLLAEIVSRVSGRPFTEWTVENIFRPLGMTSTHFHLDHQEIVKDRAYSYDGSREKGFAQSVLNYANVGATSLFTTVEDMANWMRNFEDKRVGGAAVMDRMLTQGVLTDGKKISYARGIDTGEYRGLRYFGHSGGDAGFRSDVMIIPGERFGVAVFSNLADFAPGALSRQIADIYLASRFKTPGPSPAGAALVPSKPAPKPVSLPLKSLEALQGIYWFESTQLVRKIILDKGKLFYFRNEGSQNELAPLTATEFKMVGVPDDVRVIFSDKVGPFYATLTVAVGSEPPVVGKRTEPYEPAEDELKGYAGSYYSAELDRRYEIQLKSGKLHVLYGNGEDAALAPKKKDVFGGGDLAVLAFQRDKEGAVTGFAISTGRVLNLKFTKLGS